MNIPTKTLKNGFQMPVYSLGLWQMGGRFDRDDTKDEAEIAAIRRAIDAGVTHIDTAESYGDGHAEELLKEAIKHYDRSKLFISTKVSGDHQGYDGTKEALRKSLERMGLDYVDLFMIHRFPNKDISIADTMRAIDEMVDEGLIRHVGVSNCTPKRFDEAQKHTKNKIVYNQVHFNVQYREIEEYDLLAHAEENDYFIAAWRPVQKGSLEKADVLREIAEKYGKTEYQVAINWLISQKNVITLSKTSNPDHLEENLGGLNWTMDEEDIELIRREFPDKKFVSDAVPLDYEADTEPK